MLRCPRFSTAMPTLETNRKTATAPSPVEGARVWRGPNMAARRDRWSYRLSPDDVAELDGAVGNVLARDMDILAIRRDDFPLPALSKVLRGVRDDLLHGPGFSVLRGVPVERYDRRQSAIAFLGMSAYLGEPVSQNAKGHVLGHVRDLGLGESLWTVPTARGYQTAEKLIFHSDASDFVGLLCLRTAKAGGLSRIASTGTIFNLILETRPDLARTLTEAVYRDRRGEIPEGREPWYRLPVFNVHDGRLLTNYVRSVIQKAQRFPEVPRLTGEQIEAFDLLDRTAADPAVHLELEFEPGDVQLLCNHYILHSRTAYEDHPEPERKRHLLRLWLACGEGPPLPPAYGEFMGKTASGRPNGYRMPGVPLTVPLDAEYGGPDEKHQAARKPVRPPHARPRIPPSKP